MSYALANAWPRLAGALERIPLATLPTRVAERRIVVGGCEHGVAIKYDNESAKPYGGNKVRKLEHLLARALARNRKRVATFGTVASHHALATAWYARETGLPATCFLAHQTRTAGAARVLNMHLELGTEIVRFGGDYADRIETLRRHLHGRSASVVPMGGSSWLGTAGFVNAGLELAEQVEQGLVPCPEALYIAMGTMGSAAGVALGLALAGLPVRVEAIRVGHEMFANREGLKRLVGKTAYMLRRLDPAIPAGIEERVSIRVRDEFFGSGYAKSNEETERAIAAAASELDLDLEATYTGKTMAALLHDLGRATVSRKVLFWHTYHGRDLPTGRERPADVSALPEEFLGYFD